MAGFDFAAMGRQGGAGVLAAVDRLQHELRLFRNDAMHGETGALRAEIDRLKTKVDQSLRLIRASATLVASTDLDAGDRRELARDLRDIGEMLAALAK